MTVCCLAWTERFPSPSPAISSHHPVPPPFADTTVWDYVYVDTLVAEDGEVLIVEGSGVVHGVATRESLTFEIHDGLGQDAQTIAALWDAMNTYLPLDVRFENGLYIQKIGGTQQARGITVFYKTD